MPPPADMRIHSYFDAHSENAYEKETRKLRCATCNIVAFAMRFFGFGPANGIISSEFSSKFCVHSSFETAACFIRVHSANFSRWTTSVWIAIESILLKPEAIFIPFRHRLVFGRENNCHRNYVFDSNSCLRSIFYLPIANQFHQVFFPALLLQFCACRVNDVKSTQHTRMHTNYLWVIQYSPTTPFTLLLIHCTVNTNGEQQLFSDF